MLYSAVIKITGISIKKYTIFAPRYHKCQILIHFLYTIKQTKLKKHFFLLAATAFIFCGVTNAQYSNATLNGPWILNGGITMYLNFNGSGTILNIGYAVDTTTGPVGTYSVTSGDSLHAILPVTGDTGFISGVLTSDSTAIFSFNGQPGNYMVKVQHPGALADTLTGYFIDSVTMVTTNVQFIINGAGAIASATGFTGVAGNFYTDSGFCAGFISTTDTHCVNRYIGLSGYYSNNVVTGDCFFGLLTDTTCQPHSGIGYLIRTGPGALAVNNISAKGQFWVYPNPCSNYAVIKGFEFDHTYNIAVTDITGRMILQQESSTTGGTETLNLAALAPGLYLVRVNEGQVIETLKLVKE